MYFFNSLTVNAAAVARKYGKRLDVIETVRRIIAEKEGYGKINIEEEVYSIPAYAEPQCVIMPVHKKYFQRGLIEC